MISQEIAARVLERVEKETISAKEALRKLLPKNLDYKIRGSIHAYVFETLKRLNTIDYLINLALINKNTQDLKPFIRNLIRIGVYEMKFKLVHPALATDSIVRIAKSKISPNAAALANAVLRKVENINLDDELDKIKRVNYIKYLSLKYSHPEWFVKYLIDLIGERDAIKFMIANLSTGPVYIRVNELKISMENLKRLLEKEKVLVEETKLPDVLKVVEYEKPLTALDLHEKGYYVIQDIASALVVHILNPEPGDTILDLAAAPGMKTSHIASKMENKGKIIAVDNSPERVRKMMLKLKILGIKNVECKISDGTKFKTNQKVDKVLIDPPCSSTGVFRNYPSVKWRFDEKKFRSTITIQYKMLRNAHRNLDVSGCVVYSTCSIMVEENEDNISKVLDIMKVEKISSPFGDKGIDKFKNKEYKFWRKVIRTFPHKHECSGFFIAKLLKS